MLRAVRMLRNPVLLLVIVTLSGSYAQPREQYKQAPAHHPERVDDGRAEKTLKTLSVEEKIGQLFMICLRVEFLTGRSPGYFELRNNLRKYHVGLVTKSVLAHGRSA